MTNCIKYEWAMVVLNILEQQSVSRTQTEAETY